MLAYLIYDFSKLTQHNYVTFKANNRLITALKGVEAGQEKSD